MTCTNCVLHAPAVHASYIAGKATKQVVCSLSCCYVASVLSGDSQMLGGGGLLDGTDPDLDGSEAHMDEDGREEAGTTRERSPSETAPDGDDFCMPGDEADPASVRVHTAERTSGSFTQCFDVYSSA